MGEAVEQFVRDLLGLLFVPTFVVGLSAVFVAVALRERRSKRGR